MLCVGWCDYSRTWGLWVVDLGWCERERHSLSWMRRDTATIARERERESSPLSSSSQNIIDLTREREREFATTRARPTHLAADVDEREPGLAQRGELGGGHVAR